MTGSIFKTMWCIIHFDFEIVTMPCVAQGVPRNTLSWKKKLCIIIKIFLYLLCAENTLHRKIRNTLKLKNNNNYYLFYISNQKKKPKKPKLKS